MKSKRKILTGALALAVGLSFVAPSFADEGEVDSPSTNIEPSIEDEKDEVKNALEKRISEYKDEVKDAAISSETFRSAFNFLLDNDDNPEEINEFICGELDKEEVDKLLNGELEGDKKPTSIYKSRALDIKDNDTLSLEEKKAKFKELSEEMVIAIHNAKLELINSTAIQDLKEKIQTSGLSAKSIGRLEISIDEASVEDGVYDFNAVITAYTAAKAEEKNLASKKAELEKHKATLVKLNDAVHENEITAKAARIVLENYPKLASQFIDKLNALLADSDKVLAEAKLAVEKLEAGIKALEAEIEVLEA